MEKFRTQDLPVVEYFYFLAFSFSFPATFEAISYDPQTEFNCFLSLFSLTREIGGTFLNEICISPELRPHNSTNKEVAGTSSWGEKLNPPGTKVAS